MSIDNALSGQHVTYDCETCQSGIRVPRHLLQGLSDLIADLFDHEVVDELLASYEEPIAALRKALA